MKIASYHKIIKGVLVVAILLLTLGSYAQVVPPPIPPPTPPGLPIDGGIGFLLMAGIFYGTKKYKDSSS